MLRIGIVGSGFGLYGLLPAFRSLKDTNVVAICGTKTKRLTTYCKKIGLNKIYPHWQQMLTKENLDAVALAVTPNAQYEICLSAIKKGLNIFAEKPLALNYQQAKLLAQLVEKKHIINTVDFLYPEIEAWKKVKEFINKKTFGALLQITIDWQFLSHGFKNKKIDWKNDINQGGGAVAYYFSHTLYYLEYFGGLVSQLQSKILFQDNIEIGAELLIKFKNGISGKAYLNCNAAGFNRHCLIFQFENETICLENDKSTITNFTIKTFSGKKIENLNLLSEAKIKKDEDERVRIVGKIASRFVRGCLSRKPVFPSFKEGARVQWLIEKIRMDS